MKTSYGPKGGQEMTEEINNWLDDLCFYDGAESTEEIQEEPDINCDYEEHIRCFWGF